MQSHREIDQRSLFLHRMVAQKLRVDATLVDRACSILEQWRQKVSPRSQVYLEEWDRLLHGDLEACLRVATEDSEHSAALRQSSPLACLLTPKERFNFLRHWKEEHAAQ